MTNLVNDLIIHISIFIRAIISFGICGLGIIYMFLFSKDYYKSDNYWKNLSFMAMGILVLVILSRIGVTALFKNLIR